MSQLRNKIILTYGGGNVLDCSKAIVAGACYDGDPWEIVNRAIEETYMCFESIGIPMHLREVGISVKWCTISP